jgi:predicted TIM-barrel fold metal-dependent hydrolase
MPGIDISAEYGQGGWTLADRDGVTRTMQRARFSGMALTSRQALAGDVASGNADLKAAIQGQENLFGWVTVSPVNVEASAGELRKHAAAKQMLGLRVDPRSVGEPVYTDAVLEILNGFRRFVKPALVNVHDYDDVMGLEQLAKQVPTVKFIAGGAGGDFWQECGAMAKRQTNVMLEPFTGGCHRGKLEALVGLLGAHRIFFATGYPNANPGAALGLLADARISDGEKQGIFQRNAVRLFNLALEG